MKIYKKILPYLLPILLFSSCTDNEEIDQDKPTIDFSAANAFPLACDTVYFGETFILKLSFTDNKALGSFNLDIHNNFDHHTHSTEVMECNLDDKKDAVNPYTFIQDYTIPEGLSTYETNLEVRLPASLDGERYDAGDYHFHVNLVDHAGWSSQYGIGIKILNR